MGGWDGYKAFPGDWEQLPLLASIFISWDEQIRFKCDWKPVSTCGKKIEETLISWFHKGHPGSKPVTFILFDFIALPSQISALWRGASTFPIGSAPTIEAGDLGVRSGSNRGIRRGLST